MRNFENRNRYETNMQIAGTALGALGTYGASKGWFGGGMVGNGGEYERRWFGGKKIYQGPPEPE